MWRKAYHKKYLGYIRHKTPYKTENNLDSKIFAECNEGALIYAKTLNLIEGIELNQYQCMLVRVFIPYAIRIIYHKYWHKYNDAIRALYKITDEDIESYILASVTNRQNGKSTWITVNAIALAMAVPVNHGFNFDQGFTATGNFINLITHT